MALRPILLSTYPTMDSSLPRSNASLLFLLFTTISFSFGAPLTEKKSHLHFYLHETYSGPNSNLFVVTSLNKNSSSIGTISVFDDELREGPEPTSKLIGRAQGTVTQASLVETAYLTAINFVFTKGKYNGNSLAIFGRVLFLSSTRDLNIIGGSGKFRLARGYTLGKKLDTPAGTLVVEFDLYFAHY